MISTQLEILAQKEQTILALHAKIESLEAQLDKAYDIGMESFAAFMDASHYNSIEDDYAIDVEGQEAIKEWATLPPTEETRQLRHRLFDRIRNPK